MARRHGIHRLAGHRRPAVVLLASGGALLALVRRRKASNSERELWNEATTAPDLR